VAVLGQHTGRQGEHPINASRPGLDLTHLHSQPGPAAGIIHPAIMPREDSGSADARFRGNGL
jgi:hypothetical protein